MALSLPSGALVTAVQRSVWTLALLLTELVVSSLGEGSPAGVLGNAPAVLTAAVTFTTALPRPYRSYRRGLKAQLQ